MIQKILLFRVNMAISKMDNIDYNIEGDEEEWLSLKYVTNPYNRGPQ